MTNSEGKDLKIHHFRHLAEGDRAENPKAVIFYVHGYGDYSSRYAFIGKYLSHLGYEFAGIDQRGFGDSEGTEGKIESFESSTEDHLLFHKAYVENFPHLESTPKFLMSGSFGA